MDRITKSLLDEFLAENGMLKLPEDKGFEHFVTYLMVQRYHNDTFDTGDLVLGSGNDTGIDAIAILVNGLVITDVEGLEQLTSTASSLDVMFIFVQAERSSSFDMAKIGQFSFGVVDFFKETPALPQNDMVKESAKIMAEIYAKSSKFKRGNPICKLFYATTGNWVGDENLEVRRKAAVNDLESMNIFREVDFSPVDADGLQKFYSQSKNAISREFVFSEKTVIPDIPGVTEAYLGIIPALEFISLLRDQDGNITKSLFYDNVRDWQDYNIVNSEMRDTLGSDVLKARFALMNNGVTVIAKTLRATGNKFYIEDFQIVNGCQTSHVLFNEQANLNESVMVPLRLIATEDEGVTASIIKATNRQTEIKQEQLLAVSDFQKKLEAFFSSFEESRRLFYERRSRQYNSLSGIEKTRIVTPGNLIRAFASMFLDEPHRTTRNYSALIERVGKSIFAADDKLDPYYLSAFALYRLEYLFRNQALDPKYKPARYHILFAARMLANSDHLPPMNANKMERYCSSLNEVFWDLDKSNDLLSRSAGIVESVAQGNFDRDQIRTQPFTEKVKAACIEATSKA